MPQREPGQPRIFFVHLKGGRESVLRESFMRDKPYFEALLGAMRQALSHLEDVKLARHDDPEIAQLKQGLRGKIAEFESQPSSNSSGAD